MKMLRRFTAMFLVVAGSLAAAQDGGKSKLADVLNSSISRAQSELTSAAEAMPEDKYNYAPTNGEFKGVRTFAEQIKHVAATNYVFAAMIKGEKPPNDEKGPDTVKSKADILKFSADSFTALQDAIATINDKNLLEPIPSPFGGKTTTRLAVAIMSASHPMDHYGQVVEYLRANGIVPPASRQQ